MLLSSVTVTAISFHDISEIMWRLCPWCQLTEHACVILASTTSYSHATTQAALAETPPQIVLVRAILSRSVYSSNPVKQNAPRRDETRRKQRTVNSRPVCNVTDGDPVPADVQPAQPVHGPLYRRTATRARDLASVRPGNTSQHDVGPTSVGSCRPTRPHDLTPLANLAVSRQRESNEKDHI